MNIHSQGTADSLRYSLRSRTLAYSAGHREYVLPPIESTASSLDLAYDEGKPINSDVATNARLERARSASVDQLSTTAIETQQVTIHSQVSQVTPVKSRIPQITVDSENASENVSSGEVSSNNSDQGSDHILLARSPVVTKYLQIDTQTAQSDILAQTQVIVSPSAPSCEVSTPQRSELQLSYIASNLDDNCLYRAPASHLTAQIERDQQSQECILAQKSPVQSQRTRNYEPTSVHTAMAHSSRDSTSADRPPFIAIQNSVSDTIISPEKFYGRSNENPEDFLAYFQRYSDFKQLRDRQKADLFGMLMRGGALDWYLTLDADVQQSFERLSESFKDAYFRPEQLRYADVSALYSSPQGPQESTMDYVTRLRKMAKRLELTEEMLHMAVLSGLRPHLRVHILQQGLQTLEDTVKQARLIESSTSSDPVTALLMENMKSQTQLAEAQTKQIQQLTDKINALTAVQTVPTPRDIVESRSPSSLQPHSPHEQQEYTSARFYRDQSPRRPKLTPQRVQRENYVRRQTGNRVFEPQQNRRREFEQRDAASECTNCGYRHAKGQCRAAGVTCRNCQKLNHFARVCRSARANRS